MAANPEKLALAFGLADDQALVSLANDIALGARQVIQGNLSTGLPYAALEMAYVHLGRPALEAHRPVFQKRSGLSESNYRHLLETLQVCISKEDTRAGMSEDIPMVINSVKSILKGLGLAELEPTISQVEGEFLSKLGVNLGECSIVPLAVTLACLSLNPKIFGPRLAILKLDKMAQAFLVKKMALDDKIKVVHEKCKVSLKTLNEDENFQSALTIALRKLTPSTTSKIPAILNNTKTAASQQPLSSFCFDVEIEMSEPSASAADPLPKRKRLGDPLNVDILEGYGESWGPLGVLPLLPLQQTSMWVHIEELERKHLQSLEKVHPNRSLRLK